MSENEFNFKGTEKKILDFWEKEGIYNFSFKNSKKVYSIDTPPPTVSGKMHIGHALSYSQEDFIARYQRMASGRGIVFYPFGTDDNGLPTERLIEKIKGVKSKNMSRKDFIELCLKTLKEITPDFVQDWKNLGISCDYSKIYSTIDAASRKISQKSFIDLFKKKEIYKKNFPTIWCTECQTSIAQAELEDKNTESFFSTIKFECNGKDLLIATTRPELIGACVAVFVNPKDKRYVNLAGKEASVPLFDFEVPIIADESADMSKGTGALMVCSYGDKYDVDAISRKKLKPRLVVNKNGMLTIEGYGGMKIKDARKKILEELKNQNLIKEQKQIKHVVNVHDKCGTEIEFIETEQWFIKILDKKKKFIQLGKEIKWHPEHMYKRYENWVKGLEWDWNISRDRHFGIPIPVWECKKCGKIILPDEKELPVDPLQTKKKCAKCNREAEGEEKVLDTWATSSLTPQIASAILTNNTIKIPFNLRPQGHDIIRTWAFYTIVKSYLHEKKIPWKDAMISGFVTLNGEKMSKSKGNVISPQDVLKKYGADALRFWAAGSKLGEDLDYQEKDLIAGKKFITKLRNATKFVFMNLKGKPRKPKKLERIDERFLIELNRAVSTITYRFENYEYSRAKFNTEEFFWKFFCDYYLEIVKKRIYNEKGDKKLSAQYILYHSLLTLIKLLAPIIPFVTEEIYQEYFKKYEKEKSIHITKWPSHNKKLEGWDDRNIKSHANELTLFIDLLTKVRAEKSKAQKPMNAECIITINKPNYEDLKKILEDLKDVTNAKEIREGKFKVEFI
ncbi:MAG: valine--tRNA ligase [archaeon]